MQPRKGLTPFRYATFLIRKRLSSITLSHTRELSARPDEILCKSGTVVVVQRVAEHIVGKRFSSVGSKLITPSSRAVAI